MLRKLADNDTLLLSLGVIGLFVQVFNIVWGFGSRYQVYVLLSHKPVYDFHVFLIIYACLIYVLNNISNWVETVCIYHSCKKHRDNGECAFDGVFRNYISVSDSNHRRCQVVERIYVANIGTLIQEILGVNPCVSFIEYFYFVQSETMPQKREKMANATNY